MSNSNVNPQELLEQILAAGQDLLKEGKSKSGELSVRGKDIAKKGEDYLVDKLGVDDTPSGREALRKGVGAGAAAGALALLLSSRSGRKMVTLGGLAGLGTIAYKAHKAGKMPKSADDVIGLLKGPDAEMRSEVLIMAMVAAAKADGDISDAEKLLIESEYSGASNAVLSALKTSPKAADVAKMAKTPQAAAEIYAVSCRIANGLNPKERDYLDSLAMAMNLEPDVAARIETDVRTGE